jgi:hypothetical protein
MFKEGSFLEKHYKVVRLSGSVAILLSGLGLFFFLTGVFQGYTESTLSRLLGVLIGLSTFSTILYLYRTVLGLFAIVRRSLAPESIREVFFGFVVFLVVLGLSLGSNLYRQWLTLG